MGEPITLPTTIQLDETCDACGGSGRVASPLWQSFRAEYEQAGAGRREAMDAAFGDGPYPYQGGHDITQEPEEAPCAQCGRRRLVRQARLSVADAGRPWRSCEPTGRRLVLAGGRYGMPATMEGFVASRKRGAPSQLSARRLTRLSADTGWP